MPLTDTFLAGSVDAGMQLARCDMSFSCPSHVIFIPLSGIFPSSLVLEALTGTHSGGHTALLRPARILHHADMSCRHLGLSYLISSPVLSPANRLRLGQSRGKWIPYVQIASKIPVLRPRKIGTDSMSLPW